MLSDLNSLWQIAVALNLGFGALYSFGEPTRDRINRSLVEIEALLAGLIAEKNEKSDKDTETIFRMCSSYLLLNREFYNVTTDWNFLYDYRVKIGILILSIIAFAGLFWSSLNPQDAIYPSTLALVVAVNIVPLILAVTHFILSLRLRTSVYPLAVKLQALIRATYFTEYLETRGSFAQAGV